MLQHADHLKSQAVSTITCFCGYAVCVSPAIGRFQVVLAHKALNFSQCSCDRALDSLTGASNTSCLLQDVHSTLSPT